jgi:hypothetical protein
MHVKRPANPAVKKKEEKKRQKEGKKIGLVTCSKRG